MRWFRLFVSDIYSLFYLHGFILFYIDVLYIYIYMCVFYVCACDFHFELDEINPDCDC